MCHSDVGALDGTLKLPVPTILGHEMAGVVAETGIHASRFKRGDRVVVACTDAPPNYPGWGMDGGYATKCLVKESSLHLVPDCVDIVQAAVATDAGRAALRAVEDSNAKPGDRIGVIGLGGVGMTAVRIAAIRGAEVYAAETREALWASAMQRGAAGVFGSVDEFVGLELDTIIDCVGAGTTTSGALHAVRRGGLVVQFGLHQASATIDTYELVSRRLTLKGSTDPGDIEEILTWMEQGELAIETTIVGFDEIPATLERLQHGGSMPGLAFERAPELIDDPVPLLHQGSVGEAFTYS